MLAKGTPESRKRQSEAAFARWARGPSSHDPRACVCCGEVYAPGSGRQRFCTIDCKAIDRTARSYGMEGPDYWAMFRAQGGGCALCGSTQLGLGFTSGSRLVVDHDHATGLVRGLLCSPCNIALGQFGDDIGQLQRAIQYLERNSMPARVGN
jgi:hypothetical protein